MKKRLFCLILALSLLVCCFAGCSSKQQLQFTANFYGYSEAKDPEIWGYSETTTYDVDFAKDYENRFNTSKVEINKDVIDLSYKKGSYTSTITVVSKEYFKEDSIPKSVKESDIVLEAEGEKFYVLTTEFSIPVTYKIAGEEEKTDVNTISTTTYFCSAKLSYAPIYSYTKSVNTLFDIYPTKAVREIRTLENIVNYNKNTFTATKKINDGAWTTEKKDYEFRTIIDNTQLLFIMRNLGLGEKSTRYLPTLTFTYSDPKEIAVASETVTSIKYNFNYRGNNIDEQIKVNKYKFLLANSKTAGAYQCAVVQQDASENVKNNALLTTYAHTLYGGSIGYYGVLVYTLTSVSVSEY